MMKVLKHKDALEQQTMLLHCDFMNKSQDQVNTHMVLLRAPAPAADPGKKTPG
jgi:hypothetical protein